MNGPEKGKRGPRGKTVTYIIPGNPVPLARHRHGITHAWDSQKRIKFGIGIQLSDQHNGQPLLAGPLHLFLDFFMPIPKSGPKSLDGKPHPIKPDLDNLIKMICDCANGILYKDDAAIYKITASKHYSHNPRTEITAMEML